MRENNKKDTINRFRVPLIITCAVCGFTFRLFDSLTGKENQKCPICNTNSKEYSKSKLERFYMDMV
jgi:rubrerythrin